MRRRAASLLVTTTASGGTSVNAATRGGGGEEARCGDSKGDRICNHGRQRGLEGGTTAGGEASGAAKERKFSVEIFGEASAREARGHLDSRRAMRAASAPQGQVEKHGIGGAKEHQETTTDRETSTARWAVAGELVVTPGVTSLASLRWALPGAADGRGPTRKRAERPWSRLRRKEARREGGRARQEHVFVAVVARGPSQGCGREWQVTDAPRRPVLGGAPVTLGANYLSNYRISRM